MLGTCLCPDGTRPRVQVTTSLAGRRYWPAHEKLRIIGESLVPGESVSTVAWRNGVAPNLLLRWRRLMDEGRAMAVGSNEPVVGASELRKIANRAGASSACLVARRWRTESLRRPGEGGAKNGLNRPGFPGGS